MILAPTFWGLQEDFACKRGTSSVASGAVAAKNVPLHKVIAWLEPGQVALIREAATLAHVKIVGAGSPGTAQAGAVAAELGCDAVDDLRSALTEGDADAVLIAARGEFGKNDAASDGAALLAAQARSCDVLTLEPFPLSAIDLASRGWLDAGVGARPADVARFVPLPRHMRSFREATEVFTSFGEVRSMAIEAVAPTSDGTLAARLVGALDLVAMIMGEPESIDAAYCSPIKTPGLHALPGETLDELHGDMTLNLRFSGGRAATIFASDQGGAWAFNCTAIGAGGRLRLHDHGFEWFSPTGEKADETSHRKPAKGSTAAMVLADALSRTLDPHIPDVGPMDWAMVLSMAQAALLSSRTGQSETPATFRAMLGPTMGR